jgi:hypothetical protein
MITIGSKLELFSTQTQYEIVDFKIDINDNGMRDAFIIMKSEKEGVKEYPVDMVMELLRNMQLYLPEQREMAERYNKAVEGRQKHGWHCYVCANKE